ncbi:MAG: hypothetical protein AMJ60_06915 [Desulfobacterales bacterium SG8_35]|nr:MAG: hypothetical protein AMJ60_06915 [Desulfobacterales bacterium SG8_35]
MLRRGYGFGTKFMQAAIGQKQIVTSGNMDYSVAAVICDVGLFNFTLRNLFISLLVQRNEPKKRQPVTWPT